jgi:fatty acid desaturase
MYANAQRKTASRATITHRHWTRPAVPARYAKRDAIMLYTIAVILVILWLLGLVTSYTLGGFIHILLVVAIIAILLRVINGRTPL